MFDIGFGELVVVFIVGLLVLGPERLPTAVKTVAGWIKAIRTLAANVQHELTQELQWQQLQEELDKVEQASKNMGSHELGSSVEALRKTAEAIKLSQAPADMQRKEQQDPPVDISETVVYLDANGETKQGEILTSTATINQKKAE